MNLLNISTWSINVKMFIILLSGFLIFSLINTPLSIETINAAERQVFRQVVTETALRQKAAIEQDFTLALEPFDEFQSSLLQSLSVGFTGGTPEALNITNNLLKQDLLDEMPISYTQLWLIDADGQVISNLTNFDEPRFDTRSGEGLDVSDSPAYRSGLLLAENPDMNRNVDLVIEEIDGDLSIQLVANVYDILDNFVGMLVVELNNDSIILTNIQSSGVNENIYTFVATPNNSDLVLIQDTAFLPQVNLDTQATRSSAEIREAQFYITGDRSVIGFYAPLFDSFRNDVLMIVELDESIVLADVATTILSTTTPNLLLALVIVFLGVIFINRIFVRPIHAITNMVRAMNAGDFRSSFPLKRSGDEVGRLAETVVELKQQLNALTTDMNSRMSARARDLEVTQEIGRVATTEEDVSKLMIQVVDLIVERFESIYHAQIFLIEGNYAVLKASTGEPGEQLLARGHRLGVGSLSVIGQVTQQNQTLIARDTATSEVHRRNEFLQDTHAELAIPMRLGSQVIGALDVQSKLRDAFDDDLVAILETMTSQIAIAIENSRLYEMSTRRLQELDNAARQRVQNNWEDFMYTQRARQMTSHAGAQVTLDFSELREQAARDRQIAIGNVTNRKTVPLAIPIVIRDQVLGVVEWEITESEFNQNRVLLAEELATRLAVSLDNARLVQTGRQTAENERIINTISAKISGQTDIEQILQTAIQEVGQALRAPQVNINLQQSTVNDKNGHKPTPDNA